MAIGPRGLAGWCRGVAASVPACKPGAAPDDRGIRAVADPTHGGFGNSDEIPGERPVSEKLRPRLRPIGPLLTLRRSGDEVLD
jgi:hypothetical protein